MRKALIALTAAAALTATASSPVLANQHHRHHQHNAWVAPAVGVGVGTAVGVGLYNGWYGSTAFSSIATTTAGAAAVGFVAGVGTVALIHAVTTPCQGFQALFMMKDGCVNGQYVGR